MAPKSLYGGFCLCPLAAFQLNTLTQLLGDLFYDYFMLDL